VVKKGERGKGERRTGLGVGAGGGGHTHVHVGHVGAVGHMRCVRGVRGLRDGGRGAGVGKGWTPGGRDKDGGRRMEDGVEGSGQEFGVGKNGANW